MLDFPWHKTVTRNGRDLVDILKKCKDEKSELWAQTFDELLSRSENFPRAWKTRMVEAIRSSGPPSGPPPVNNFFTGALKDAEGKEHLLVLNLASHPVIPSDVYLICYLFDANGKWEDGGECGGGGLFATKKVKPDKTGRVQSFEITSNAPPIAYNFTVRGGKLGFAVLKDGKPLDPTRFNNVEVVPFRDLSD